MFVGPFPTSPVPIQKLPFLSDNVCADVLYFIAFGIIINRFDL
jgi:hypothetical protein